MQPTANTPNNNRQAASDHLANERTMLAWVRTGIGIVAFGFAVVKFSLFIKQISSVLHMPDVPQQHGYSAMIGIVLVGVGACYYLLIVPAVPQNGAATH